MFTMVVFDIVDLGPGFVHRPVKRTTFAVKTENGAPMQTMGSLIVELSVQFVLKDRNRYTY